MPGTPKKRAKREAAERAKNMAAGAAEIAAASAPNEGPAQGQAKPGDGAAAIPTKEVSAPLQGEVLPPASAGTDPTRTALKRAMRARAQEHAEKAIAVLARNLDSDDPKLARDAANDILAWGFGKPATEIEAGDGAQMIVIRRFGEDL